MRLEGHRGGATYEADKDYARLNKQAKDVWLVMIRGGSYTLRQIEVATGHPQASISARLRDFRKPQFGGHTVTRLRGESGRHYYGLIRKVT